MHDVATKPDLEAIMRRLKGSKEPGPIQAAKPPVACISNDETTNELKRIAKMLGAKLKIVIEEKLCLQGLLNQKEKEIASIQSLCIEKDETISTLQKAHESLKQPSLVPIQEEELSQLRDTQNRWTASQDQHRQAEEELTQLRNAQSEWLDERALLLKELQNERSTKQNLGSEQSAQVLRIAMTCRQLEDEIHALTCERAATLRQYRELKEGHEHLEDSLEKCLRQIANQEAELLQNENEISSLQAAHASLNTSYKDLQNHNMRDKLENENQRSQIETLQTLIAELKEGLLNLTKHADLLKEGLESKEEALQSLQGEYSSLRDALESTTDEKNKSLQHVQEVEEVLVLKLTLISELQEQLASLHAATTSLQQNNDSLHHAMQQALDELKQLEAEHASLLDAHANTKQQLQQAEKNNANLIERTERHECLLNTIRDAKEQASGLLKILENGKTPSISVAKLVEELSIRPEDVSGILVEDRFEQHDLF